MTAERTSSVNSEGIYEPFSTEDVPWEEFRKGDRFGSRFRQLGKFGGGSHVGVALEELPPGRQSNPAHLHMLEEEHVYVLEGTLTLVLGAGSHEMSAGDYVCFPAGQEAGHALVNPGDATWRYLIIGERNPNEVAVFPESGRVSVRLTREGYRKSVTMDYREGVRTGSAPDS
jgi:uncharacterized cupin superfamily protein